MSNNASTIEVPNSVQHESHDVWLEDQWSIHVALAHKQ